MIFVHFGREEDPHQIGNGDDRELLSSLVENATNAGVFGIFKT